MLQWLVTKQMQSMRADKLHVVDPVCHGLNFHRDSVRQSSTIVFHVRPKVMNWWQTRVLSTFGFFSPRGCTSRGIGRPQKREKDALFVLHMRPGPHPPFPLLSSPVVPHVWCGMLIRHPTRRKKNPKSGPDPWSRVINPMTLTWLLAYDWRLCLTFIQIIIIPLITFLINHMV